MKFDTVGKLHIALGERGVGPDFKPRGPISPKSTDINYALSHGYDVLKRNCHSTFDIEEGDLEYLVNCGLIQVVTSQQIIGEHDILPEDIPTLYDRLGVIKFGDREKLILANSSIEHSRNLVEYHRGQLSGLRRFFATKSTIAKREGKLKEKEQELAKFEGILETERKDIADRLARLPLSVIKLGEDELKQKIAEVGVYFRTMNGVYFALMPKISEVFNLFGDSPLWWMAGELPGKVFACDFQRIYPNWSWIGNKDALISISNTSKEMDASPEEVVQVCEALYKDLSQAGVKPSFTRYDPSKPPRYYGISDDHAVTIYPAFVQRAKTLAEMLDKSRDIEMTIEKTEARRVQLIDLTDTPHDRIEYNYNSFYPESMRAYAPYPWESLGALLDRLSSNSLDISSMKDLGTITHPYETKKRFSVSVTPISKMSRQEQISGVMIRDEYGEDHPVFGPSIVPTVVGNVKELWELTTYKLNVAFHQNAPPNP